MGLQHFVHEIKAVITCCAAGLPFDAWTKKNKREFQGKRLSDARKSGTHKKIDWNIQSCIWIRLLGGEIACQLT
jgi:hypothetical protein